MRRGPRPHSYFQRFRSNFDEDAKTFDGVPVSLKHASRIDSDTSTLLEVTLNHMDECFMSVEENVIFTSSAIFDLLHGQKGLMTGTLAMKSYSFGKMRCGCA